jgi:hypothetical protein
MNIENCLSSSGNHSCTSDKSGVHLLPGSGFLGLGFCSTDTHPLDIKVHLIFLVVNEGPRRAVPFLLCLFRQ